MEWKFVRGFLVCGFVNDEWRNEEWHHGKMAASGRIGDEGRGHFAADGPFALANRGGESGGAGANAAHLPLESVALCGGQRLGVHHQTVRRCVEWAVPGQCPPSGTPSRELIELLKLRCRLSRSHRDQVDPPQSFRARPPREPRTASLLDRPAVSSSPSRPGMIPGSTWSRASSPNSPVRSRATG
jgi:hypothetical protein